MELKDLVGKHLLDAVDFDNEQIKNWARYEDCQVMRFRLDGKVYSAIEDPDDGYRSSMRELVVSEPPMKNTFKPVGVVGRHRTAQTGCYRASDVLELIDIETGKIVLIVGTENTDGYYPYYVASFHPENMATNAAAD